MTLPDQPRNHHVCYMLFAINVAVGMMCFNKQGLESTVRALALVPELVKEGQVWRLLTCAWLPTMSPFWNLLAKFFIYVSFAPGVEQVWGTRRFVTYYLFAVLVASLTAFGMGNIYIGSGLPDIAILVASCLLFPHQKVMLFFALPFPAKPIGIVLGLAFVISAASDGVRGVPDLVGAGCALTYLLIMLAKPRLLARRVSKRVSGILSMDATQAAEVLPDDVLEAQVRQVVSERRAERTVTPEQRAFVEEFIRRIDPGKELCVPEPNTGQDGMCPICRELGLCLRRFLETRRDVSASEMGKNAEAPSTQREREGEPSYERDRR